MLFRSDGTPATTSGACGTAYVAELCIKGLPPLAEELLGTPETTSLMHVPVRREQAMLKPLAHQTSVEGDFTEVAKGLRTFSVESTAIRTKYPVDWKVSREYVIPSEEYSGLDIGSKLILDAYADADSIALKNQKTRNRVVLWASVFASLGALFQAVNGIFPKTHWFALYGFGVTFAVVLYLFFLRIKKAENNYLEFRALAEGYRVQLFWRLAGVEKYASDHYLQFVRKDVGWLRDGLKNVTLYANLIGGSVHKNIEQVSRLWVDDQAKFFRKNAPEKRLSARNWSMVCDATFVIGASLVASGGLAKIISAPDIFSSVFSASSSEIGRAHV